MTRNGIAMRTPVKDISILGRATRGVRCVRLQEDDALVSAARIEKIEEVKKETPAEADDSPEA
jgi:DNA gyrase subunit A